MVKKMTFEEMVNSRPMTEVLAEGKEDLCNVLVSSGINCTTCQFSNTEQPLDMGVCEKTNEFITCSGLTVCMQWRQRQNEG